MDDRTTEKLIQEISELNHSINNFDKNLSSSIKDKFSGGNYSKRQEKLNNIDYFNEQSEKFKKRAYATGSIEDKRRSEKFKKQAELAEKEALGLKKAATASAVKMIGDMAVSAAGKITDLMVKMNELAIKERQINLQAAQKSLQIQTALYGGAIKKGLSVATNTVVGDLKEASREAMSSAMEIGKESLAANVDLKRIEFEKNTDLQINSINKQVTMLKGTLGAVGEAASAIPNPISMAAGALVSIGLGIFTASKEMDIAKLNFAKEQMEFLANFKKDMMEQAKGIVESFIKLTNGIDKLLMDLDNNSHVIGRSFGFATSQVNSYVKASAQLNIDMAEMGKTYEDLMKAQQAYISASDRNVLMNGEEGKRISALGKLFNMEEGEVGGMMGSLNLFNASIESGSDMMFQMYKTANRMGVSNQKFAKDMQKNLKLAEKYQFKGGVKGMMEMAAWAQKTRFNLDEFAGALEKMHTGNVEDVLTTSAKLNVLGGTAGVLSDPMSMLYNAYMDPTAYAKNINQMISGYGMFNSKTGETDFNMVEMMRMEAMAGALGVSKESFMNQARQAKKESQIRKNFGNKFGDKTGFVTQHATYDKGEWVANVFGKDKNGNTTVVQKKLNDLTDEDINNIFPEDTQEQLVTYTKGIFSLLEEQKVIENTNRSKISAGTQAKHRAETLKTFNYTREHNDKYRVNYIQEVEKALGFQTGSMERMLEISAAAFKENEEGRTISDSYYSASLESLDDLKEKIPIFQEGVEGVITGNVERILDAMYKLNPQAASNVAQAIARTEGTTAMTREKKAEVTRNVMKLYDRDGDGTIYGRDLTKADLDNISEILSTVYNVKREGQGGFLGMNNWRSNEGWIRNFLEEGYGYIKNGRLYWTNGNEISLDNVNGNEEVVNPNGSGHRAMFGYPTKVNDFIARPNGVIETHPKDTIVGFTNGEAITKNGQNKTDNINLTVNGTLTLSSGNQKVDLMELVRNDPNSLRRLTEQILLEASRNKYGGRNEYNADRYTIG